MAVMRPTRPKDIAVEPVRHEPSKHKGVTVDTQHVPTTMLTTYLEGQAWAVDYYSQVKDLGEGLSSHDLDLPAIYQQYKLIRGFELKVTAPLSVSQDSESKEMSYTGSANVYGVLIPNEGDMFIADIGDGREGLFSITNTQRLSVFKDTAHSVEYKLISYNTEESRADLGRKVIHTLYFDLDYLRTGNNPLITEETVDLRAKLYDHYTRIVMVYFNDFYSREMNTLLVPDQHQITYDPFVVKFVLSILGTEDHPYIRNIEQLNVSQDIMMYEMTLWHCLEKMDHRLLHMCTHSMSKVHVNAFFSRPMYNSIYFTKVKRVIYPDQRSTNVDAQYNTPAIMSLEPVLQGEDRFSALDRPNHRYTGFEALDQQPLIKAVTIDDRYVLSESFYNDSTANSVLEQLVECALKGQPIDLGQLNALCEDALAWPNLERFYYYPLLMTLLKIYPRNL